MFCAFLKEISTILVFETKELKSHEILGLSSLFCGNVIYF
jgi:hypothetical protein